MAMNGREELKLQNKKLKGKLGLNSGKMLPQNKKQKEKLRSNNKGKNSMIKFIKKSQDNMKTDVLVDKVDDEAVLEVAMEVVMEDNNVDNQVVLINRVNIAKTMVTVEIKMMSLEIINVQLIKIKIIKIEAISQKKIMKIILKAINTEFKFMEIKINM